MGTRRVDSVHIDAALTNLSINTAAEQGMIADIVSPIVPVAKESDVYWVYSNEGLKLHDVRRADRAEANEMETSYTTATFTCEEKALKELVSDREQANADPGIDPKMDAVEDLTLALRLAREVEVQTLIQTAGNWTGSSTPSVKWDAAASVIDKDFDTAIMAFRLQCGRVPNMVVTSDAVVRAIIRWLRNQPSGKVSGPNFLNVEQYKALDMSSEFSGEDARLKGLFGIDRWVVGKQVYDSAKVGSTASLANVWGNHATLLYVNPRPRRRSMSASYTFQSRGFQVKRYRLESRASDVIEVSRVDVAKAVSAACGYHFYTVLT